MREHETGQVAASAAQIYEQFFVPALFVDWPARVLAAVEVQGGERLLDVACGTGILARSAAEIIGPTGTVVGIDINEDMLAVARTSAANVSWKKGAAESLPFEAASFDRVVSQFGLMFFQDPRKAIAEMRRVCRPGGKISIAVWGSLKDTPGYAMVAAILNDLFGAEIAASIEAPYALGDVSKLRSLFADAGENDVVIETLPGKARFKSVESWIYTDIKGWTLANVIDDADFERFKLAASKRLSQFELADGTVEFDAPATVISIAA